MLLRRTRSLPVVRSISFTSVLVTLAEIGFGIELVGKPNRQAEISGSILFSGPYLNHFAWPEGLCIAGFLGFCPVAISGRDFKAVVAAHLQHHGVEARARRLWLEAQDVPVRNMVGDGLQTVLKARFICELEVLATGKTGDSLRDVLL